MGLDVYLYKYTQFAERVAAEKAREQQHEANWSDALGSRKYEELTETEKQALDAKNNTYDAEHPLPGSEEKIELDSVKYPEHYFKVGYLRSSYNGSGINSVLRNMIGKELHDIFGVTRGDDYHVKPDWSKSRERAAALLDEFNAYVGANGFLRVMEVSHNPFGSPSETPGNEKEALEVFAKIRRGHAMKPAGDLFGNDFSNRDGHFFLDGEGFKIRALIPGRSKFVGREMLATYVVYESNADFYRQALEITIEMCDWALAQAQDPAVEYVLHWSG